MSKTVCVFLSFSILLRGANIAAKKCRTKIVQTAKTSESWERNGRVETDVFDECAIICAVVELPFLFFLRALSSLTRKERKRWENEAATGI